MPNTRDAFILYSLPLRSTDTPPAWTKWDMAVDMKELIEKHGIAGTWLPRFDALRDSRYRDLCLAVDSRQEVGLWMEITSSHAAAAGVPYRLQPGEEWYEAQHCLTLGYTQPERVRLCDAAMDLFRQVFGRHPRTVSMWMLDTFSANYLAERYGVRAIGLCRNQYGIDGYTLWGGWPNLPYRPSRRYVWRPASEPEDAAGYVVYPVISEDLVADYGNDRHIWSTEVCMIQQRNLPSSLVEEYVNPLSELCLRGAPVSLVSCVAENGWAWPRLKPDYDRQLAFFADLVRRGEARSVTAEDYAEWYGRTWPGLSPSQAWHQPPGLPNTVTDFGCVMACTRRYRARLRVNPARGVCDLTDLRAYDCAAVDPYWETTARERFGRWVHPFVLDASRFRPEGKVKAPVVDAREPVMALAVEVEGGGALDLESGELDWPSPSEARWRNGRVEAEWRFEEEAIALSARARREGERVALVLRINPAVLPLAMDWDDRVTPMEELEPVDGRAENVLLRNLDPEAGRAALRISCAGGLSVRWAPGAPMGRLVLTSPPGRDLALRLEPLIAGR